MNLVTTVRKLSGAILLLLGIVLASLVFGQGALNPPGAPAPTMKSLQEVSDQLTTLTALSPTQKFTGYGFVPAPAASGGKSCTSIPIAAGSLVKIESVAGVTYTDPSAIAYLRYLVKDTASTSRILALRLPSEAALSDPVSNSRSVYQTLVLWLGGGNGFDVSIGDAHSMSVCIQSSTGQLASGALILTGTYVTPPSAARAVSPVSSDGGDPKTQVTAPAPSPAK